ncbi:hypothetical protein D3C81_1496600 [compost metagenome]
MYTLQVFAAFFIDIFAYRLRAYKGNGFDFRVLQNTIHDVVCTIYYIEDAFRQSGFCEQLYQLFGQKRRSFGWLEDKGITERNSHREHPARHHHREIKRCNPAYDTNRIAVISCFDIRCDGG